MITSTRVHANGLGFMVHEAGAAKTAVDAAPVLLLHGFPEMGRYWWPTMCTLAGRNPLLHLIAPDLRGCGESDEPPAEDGACAIEPLMADVLALLDARGITQVHLVGHDWGGVLAWWLAACHPARVRCLVAVNAPHPAALQARLSHDPAQQAASAYLTRLQQPGAAERLLADGAEALWTRLRGPATGYDSDDRAAWIDTWQRRGIAGAVAWYRDSHFIVGAQAPVAWMDRLGSLAVRCPTLVVWGLNDGTFVRALAEESVAFAHQAQLLTLAEAAHHPPREAPQAFHAALQAFIADHT